MSDQTPDTYSVKNLLFNRAMPNYIAAVAPEYMSHLHSCLDCGDKFVFESSLNNHKNRKSMKITFTCHLCQSSQLKTFFNRCNLLSHIRSHSFKFVTVNVADLKIDPLPTTVFNTKPRKQNRPKTTTTTTVTTDQGVICFECNIKLSDTLYEPERIYLKDHYTKPTNGISGNNYTCPVCLFSLPNICALKAHIRIHLKIPPYFCPQCGSSLPAHVTRYPYTHHCAGFNIMRSTTRLKCPVNDCSSQHPNDFNNHLITEHMKRVYKCPSCDVACFSEATILKHIMKTHTYLRGNVIIFYQCQLCPGRLVVQNRMDRHVKNHNRDFIYPCWTCDIGFHDIPNLIDHHLERHNVNEETKQMYMSVRNSDFRKTYRVVKRCDQCKGSFAYRCKYSEITALPNICPNKCSTNVVVGSNNSNQQIMCTLCKIKINENWKDIKQHYVSCHKNYKCLDIKVPVVKMDMKKYYKKYKKQYRNSIRKSTKRTFKKVTKPMSINVCPDTSNLSNNLICKVCQYSCNNDIEFQAHIKQHCDPCLAYQCMECGQCFAVKPSFSTHLLMDHEIPNVDDYILRKQCYNDSALSVQLSNSNELNSPLNDYQCKICREQFNNNDDLEKHFRVHGMAFLEKNQNKSNMSQN
ncbi:hypothetical protein ACJJTC_008028 [Scirpophaga incertulas]